jgi:hypothetical protein
MTTWVLKSDRIEVQHVLDMIDQWVLQEPRVSRFEVSYRLNGYVVTLLVDRLEAAQPPEATDG